ncbi:AAA family ATPase [Sinorhizobium meliloti]|nr:AAA family ATPase [Sinorhizobium meliloti]MDW9881270.1 AAA family ATPase [Sinorhizobium meliloti]
MYLKNLELENYGPIALLRCNFPFNEDGRPKPVVFVGQNGSGKSIVLSHIVNALLSAKSAVFTDGEVETGKVYKLRSPGYISHGEHFYRSKLEFDNEFSQVEYQLTQTRREFEANLGYTPTDPQWNSIPENEISYYNSTFHQSTDKLEEIFSKSSYLYFPPNRFEEPAWLNSDNLLNTVTYNHSKPIKGFSNKRIINYSPMRENQSWILDVIYDSFATERKIHQLPVGGGATFLPVLLGTEGPATNLRVAIEEFFLALMQKKGPISWSVGGRGRRQISINSPSGPIAPNIFALSTGQTGLLNIFLTLIRDYDLTGNKISALSDIKGVVVVDEVDMHLHTELQHTILPELISLFPQVQFIMTSHSPLFILGLHKKLGDGRFDVIELPSGDSIGVERFSEFEKAYSYFKDSVRFEQDIRSQITESQSPILFAEGSIDVDYLLRAAELLGREETIQKYRVLDANGFGGLDKIWKHFDTHFAELMNRRVTLLYDCDIAKGDAAKAGVRRIIIPQQGRRVTKGIENLFPDELIANARAAKASFIDVTPGYTKTVRGESVPVDERWEVNPDEKRNLADWIIANGTADDFSPFSAVFDLLDAASP